MDAPTEAAFDRFTKLAAKWLRVPVALLSLVDDHRQFFKSAVGLPEPWASQRETPLTHSFCQYGVTTGEPLIVVDARTHPWLKHNLAITELGVIAYAGVPLITPQAQVLGMFCAIDSQPRSWSAEDIEMLHELAALVCTELELRAHLRELAAVQVAREQDQVLLRSVLDCMEDAVVVTAADGRIILSNHAAQRGRPAEVLETAKGMAEFGVFLADGQTPVPLSASPAMRALKGENVRDADFVRRQPGKADEWHSVNSSPIRDASGQIKAAVSVGRNVTEAKRAQEALVHSEALFRTVVQNLPNGAVLLFDMDLRYLMAEGEHLLSSMGFSTDNLVGKTVFEVAPEVRASPVAVRYRAALAGVVQEFEVVRDGRIFAATIIPVHNALGLVVAGMALVYDVTAHKHVQNELLQQARSVALLQAIVCAFMSWPVGHVYLVDGSVLKTSGWWHDDDPDRFAGFRAQTSAIEFQIDQGMIGQVLGSGLATWLSDLGDEASYQRSGSAGAAGLTSGFAFPVLIADEVVAVLEFYSERREEADLPLLSLMANIGTQLGRVVERERARKASEERAEAIRSQSIRDELTGLYNRRGFMELAQQRLHIAKRERRAALLFFVDLNGMKQINDERGHEEGDRALVDTANVLREAFRASDVIARLGGDEFVALLLDANASQIQSFAARIQSSLTTLNTQGLRGYRLSASVGASEYDSSQGEGVEALLVQADVLMYEQKRARRAGLAQSMLPPNSQGTSAKKA